MRWIALDAAAGSVPADPERLRRLLGYDKGTFGSAWPQVSTKFVTSDGRLFNERLSRLGLAGTGRDSQAGPRPPRSSDPKP